MSGWCVCACNAKGRVQFWKVSRRIQTWDATRRRNSELLKLGIPNSQKLQNSNWRICGLVHITWGSKPSWLLAFPSGLKPSLTAGSYWSLSTVCTRGLQQMKDRLFSYRWPVAIFSIYILFIFVYFVIVFQASINLRNILEVREKEQLVSLETTLRLYWKVRLKQSLPTHP